MRLFKQIEVWQRISAGKGVRIFQCFEDFATGLFHVQRADSFYADEQGNWHAGATEGLDRSRHESVILFGEEPINERSQGEATLAVAVAKFDADFADFFEEDFD